MKDKHLTVARRQIDSAHSHESKGLYNLAISLYRMAKNRFKMAGGEQGKISFINSKITHCQTMVEDQDDDNQ